MLSHGTQSTLRIALWGLATALGLSRFFWLAADFPNYSPWIFDQAKFTDEGWWANAAVMHALTGHWHIAGDYNPAAAVPIWPLLLGTVFHFTGINIVAARALSAAFSLATLGVIYFLVRRYAESRIVAEVSVVLMAASPFAFAFSRLAILDTLVVFEFCLMLLVASFATNTGKRGIWLLIALALLVTAALLTKTTVAVLLPAVAWIAFRASAKSSSPGRNRRTFALALTAVAVAPLALLKLWALIVSWLGYGTDYAYFFNVNAMPDIDWPQTFHWLHDLAVNGMWIDRLLYPLALAILLAALTFRRRLWHNPLFTASWLAIAGAAAFIFSRQDDYAPRYFLAMLAPVIFIVVLAFDDVLVRHRRLQPALDETLGAPSIERLLLDGWETTNLGTATVGSSFQSGLDRTVSGILAAAIAIAVAFNSATIVGLLAHRTYQLYGAAQDVAAHVRADRSRSQLLFGVSAAEVGLIDRLPSINGAYSIHDMAANVARYKPGWYLAWNDGIDYDALARHTIVPVASYKIFDDDERTTLTLYELR